MHRKCRQAFDEPGHLHELTFSTYRRIPVLRYPECADIVLATLERARELLSFQVHAYVIMPEHVHVLIGPQHGTKVSAILARIKQPASQRIAKSLRRSNPQLADLMRVKVSEDKWETRIWQQGGGFDRNVYSSEVARKMINYIHQNPIRRGMCRLPEEYTYSSAGDYLGKPGRVKVEFPPL